MNTNKEQHRAILQCIAHRAMLERGLLPDFSAVALSELARIQGPVLSDGGPVRDTRSLLWSSIDNDDSLDLDQLTIAVEMPAGLDVGHELRVRLIETNVDRGYIDFERVSLRRHA